MNSDKTLYANDCDYMKKIYDDYNKEAYLRLIYLCREAEEEEERRWFVMHVVGIPPTLESIKDSGLYLELLQDYWHYQEVTWFDLYLINLSLSLSLTPSPPSQE